MKTPRFFLIAVMGIVCLCTSETLASYTHTGTQEFSTSLEMGAPIQTRDGVYRFLIDNGSKGFSVRCDENPNSICYEAVPNPDGSVNMVLDPCGEAIPIIIPQGTTLEIEQGIDPVTGTGFELHTFEYPSDEN